MEKLAAIQEIKTLVSRYESNKLDYARASSRYSEADLRADFLDNFFAILGWDIRNISGKPQRYREVIRETRVNIDKRIKKPDYEFRLGVQRKFFIEAKRPAVNLLNDTDSTFQIRRYGWSAGLPISIITNFEFLIFYDTTAEPRKTDSSNYGRLLKYNYEEYIKKFDEIYELISKKAVYSGSFDEKFKKLYKKRHLESIDGIFLNKINQWRLDLSKAIVNTRPNIDIGLLNELVLRLIHRILFLRMCEDRGIHTYEYLKGVVHKGKWGDFVELLKKADQRFDSSIFDITNDPLCQSSQDNIELPKEVLENIVNSLYFPEAPYTFAVFEPEFLGEVYEFFLLKRVIILNGKVALEDKLKDIDRDIVPTPRQVIDYIVNTLIEPNTKELDAENVLKKKILDPACGSGGFLLSAFDYLVNHAVEFYKRTGQNQFIYQDADSWKLVFDKKKEILEKCLYGVDRDLAATEVTRFSLMVKLLEDENQQSLPSGNRILPFLNQNIVNGDSLIDDSIYRFEKNPSTIGPPLTWGSDISCPFDFVIGNPPYLKTESMINNEQSEYKFYQRFYRTAYRQFDKYYLFIERALSKFLSSKGLLCFIISRKFSHIESGKKLRSLISKGRHLFKLIDFGNAQLFEGRTTYTCLIYLSKSGINKPVSNNDDLISYELINSPKEWLDRSIKSPLLERKIPRTFVSGELSWILCNNKYEIELISALFKDSVPLKKEFDVFNGIQTSCNDVYVIKEWRCKNKDTLVFKNQNKEWNIEKAITKPFFHDGNLNSFFPLPITARVIFPYALEVGNDGSLEAKIISPKEMKEGFPKAYAWLAYNKKKLICPPRDVQPRPFPLGEWYRYGRDQSLTVFEKRPKIVVGVNSTGDKYVIDESNTLLASGGTAGECAIAYYREKEKGTNYSLYFLVALLNHKGMNIFI